MNWQMINALLIKDVTLYFKNRFFAFITVLGLVAYITVYFLLPNSVDETLEMALYAPSLPAMFSEELENEGLEISQMDSEAALREAVTSGDQPVGVVLPADFAQAVAGGSEAQVQLLFAADFPEEFKQLYVILLQEIAYNMSGRPLNVTPDEEILGPDMAGQQIPPRNRSLPLFAILVLVIETLGLASLISSEVEGRTLRALLVTPLRVSGLFVSKGILGVGLAFTQALILMGVTGGLAERPLLMIVTLLLGSLLATGLGFLVASVARDLMSVMGWGILAILLLMIPTLNVMAPGAVTGWIQLIPSFYLVDTVHRVLNFGATWTDVGGNLIILLISSLAFYGLGIWALWRKLQ